MSTSLEHAIRCVARDYTALARFARRRERFLDALDWSCLDDRFARETSMADDLINDHLADLWLYLEHLEQRVCDGRVAPLSEAL